MARKLTKILSKKAEIIRSVILSKTTHLDDFEYPGENSGLVETPEQTKNAQYDAQLLLSKSLLDSVKGIGDYNQKVFHQNLLRG